MRRFLRVWSVFQYVDSPTANPARAAHRQDEHIVDCHTKTQKQVAGVRNEAKASSTHDEQFRVFFDDQLYCKSICDCKIRSMVVYEKDSRDERMEKSYSITVYVIWSTVEKTTFKEFA